MINHNVIKPISFDTVNKNVGPPDDDLNRVMKSLQMSSMYGTLPSYMASWDVPEGTKASNLTHGQCWTIACQNKHLLMAKKSNPYHLLDILVSTNDISLNHNTMSYKDAEGETKTYKSVCCVPIDVTVDSADAVRTVQAVAVSNVIPLFVNVGEPNNANPQGTFKQIEIKKGLNFPNFKNLVSVRSEMLEDYTKTSVTARDNIYSRIVISDAAVRSKLFSTVFQGLPSVAVNVKMTASYNQFVDKYNADFSKQIPHSDMWYFDSKQIPPLKTTKSLDTLYQFINQSSGTRGGDSKRGVFTMPYLGMELSVSTLKSYCRARDIIQLISKDSIKWVHYRNSEFEVNVARILAKNGYFVWVEGGGKPKFDPAQGPGIYGSIPPTAKYITWEPPVVVQPAIDKKSISFDNLNIAYDEVIEKFENAHKNRTRMIVEVSMTKKMLNLPDYIFMYPVSHASRATVYLQNIISAGFSLEQYTLRASLASCLRNVFPAYRMSFPRFDPFRKYIDWNMSLIIPRISAVKNGKLLELEDYEVGDVEELSQLDPQFEFDRKSYEDNFYKTELAMEHFIAVLNDKPITGRVANELAGASLAEIKGNSIYGPMYRKVMADRGMVEEEAKPEVPVLSMMNLPPSTVVSKAAVNEVLELKFESIKTSELFDEDY